MPRTVPVLSSPLTTATQEFSDNDANAEVNEKLTVLVAHDTATGSVMGLPVASKGGADLKFAAVELTRFIQSLSRNTIELQCDSEPSTRSLQNVVVGVRTKLGFQTKVRNVAVGSHASNGNGEKGVDLIRGLSNVLLDQARRKYGVQIGVGHPLMSW